MTRTAYTDGPSINGHMAKPANQDGKWMEPQIATSFVAADLIYTTPAQYHASFVESLMSGMGESRSIRMLRESVLTDRKAQLWVRKLAASCPEQVGLGPGWEVIKFHDKTFLMHTGMDPGVLTLGYFDPSARSGVIIFTNSSNGPHIILPVLELLNADPDFIAFLAAKGSAARPPRGLRDITMNQRRHSEKRHRSSRLLFLFICCFAATVTASVTTRCSCAGACPDAASIHERVATERCTSVVVL